MMMMMMIQASYSKTKAFFTLSGRSCERIVMREKKAAQVFRSKKLYTSAYVHISSFFSDWTWMLGIVSKASQ